MENNEIKIVLSERVHCLMPINIVLIGKAKTRGSNAEVIEMATLHVNSYWFYGSAVKFFVNLEHSQSIGLKGKTFSIVY